MILIHLPSGYVNIMTQLQKITILQLGKPSISMGHFPQLFVCLPKGIPIQEMTLPETIRLNVKQGKHPCCCTNKDCEVLRCQQNLRYMVHCVQCYFGTSNPFPIGSMVLLYIYGVPWIPSIYHQYTPVMLALIYQYPGSYGHPKKKLKARFVGAESAGLSKKSTQT